MKGAFRLEISAWYNFLMGNFIYGIVIICAFVGFLISFYVFHKKRAKEAMICPLNFSCDTVIYSRYSKFFGIPLEYLGMGYYGFIAVSYIFILAYPQNIFTIFNFALPALTFLAFLFSLYLTFIQAFNLKQWCTWCLFSATTSTIIFISVFSTHPLVQAPLLMFLENNRGLMLGLHLFGVALGLGGATISDILFFKFLKDLKISQEESEVLHTLSEIVWFGLGIIILSGLGVYAPMAEKYLASSKFISKMMIFLVIITNGVLLNLLVAPKLVLISFGKKHHHEMGELHRLRKLAFALGSVSFVSWYSVFILGSIKSLPYTVSEILLSYLVILATGVIISQLLENHLGKKPMTE